MFYTKLKSYVPFHKTYMYMDIDDYAADQLFIEKKVSVRFLSHFKKKDEKYLFIVARIKSKDETLFLEALNELPDKMAILGYADYEYQANYWFELVTEERVKQKEKRTRRIRNA